MTEKRFTIKHFESTDWVYDNGTYIDTKMIVECLNRLHEENTALKSDRARYEEETRLDTFKELTEENQRLKGRIQEYEEILHDDTITNLETEIAKLKEENQALKTDRIRYEEECRLDVFQKLIEERQCLEQKMEEVLQKYFDNYSIMAMELRADQYGNKVCHDVMEVIKEIADELGVELIDFNVFI